MVVCGSSARKARKETVLLPERNIRVARGNLARLGNTLGTLGTLARVEAANLAARIQGTVPRGHYMEDLAEYIEVLPGTSPKDFDAVLEAMGINPHHVLAQFRSSLEGYLEGEVLVVEVVNEDIACALVTLRERTPMADLAKALLGEETPTKTVVPIEVSTTSSPPRPDKASVLRAPTLPSGGSRFSRPPPVSLRGGGKNPLLTRKPPSADEPGNRSGVVPYPSTARAPTKSSS